MSFEQMTKVEATAHAIELARLPFKKFCPLIGKNCDNDCVCYRTAKIIHSSDPKVFYVSANQCDNQMFFRECMVQF